MLVLDTNLGIFLKNIIIVIFNALRHHLLHLQKIKKNTNLHVLVLNIGVFLRKTWKLSILVVLDGNLGIVFKNIIIDIYEGVRLHFLHF